MNPKKSVMKATGGLAGAFALAGGTSVYGAIVSVAPPGDYSVPLGTSTGPVGNPDYDATYAGDRPWDVDGNGTNDFFFRLRYPGAPAGGTGIEWQDTFNPFTGLGATNGAISYTGGFGARYGFALAAGANIGPGGAFSTGAGVILGSRYYSAGTPSFYGGFAAGPNANGAVTPGTTAFAGFRFNAPDGTHYGYIQLNLNAGTYDFVSAAYETTPGTAIAAGAQPIPEPGTLAMLAVGAVGALGAAVSRRRNKQ